jgi:predicted nucleic acid-binding protein
MRTILLDANIFLRFLTGSGPDEQVRKTRTLFKQIKTQQVLAYVHTLTLHEVIYVSLYVYKLDREKLADLLKQLLSLVNLEIYDFPKAFTLQALQIFASRNLDWPDCLLAEIAKQDELQVASFDQDFTKLGLKEARTAWWRPSFSKES